MKNEIIADYLENWQHNARNALALAAIIGSGMAPLANAATGEDAHQAKHSSGLENIAKEPGSALKVTNKQRSEIKDSTVKLGISYYDTNSGIQQLWDTDVKVSYPKPNDKWLLGAGHGYDAETGSASGAFRDPSAPNAKAENYFNSNDIWDYTVVGTQKQPNINDPIADVDGISVDTDNEDIAMLKVSPQAPPYAIDPNSSSYNQIPALSLNKLVYLNEKLPIGEQVAVYGIPVTNNDKPIGTTGTLIGQYPIKTFDGSGKNGKQTFEWVAAKVPSPTTDPGEDGGSGSGAITATNNLLAPLSYRISEGYGKKRVYDANTDPESFDQKTIKELERESGINLRPFNVLYGYTVAPKNVGRVLLNGFNMSHTYPASTIGTEMVKRLPSSKTLAAEMLHQTAKS